jgi:hypothetical protein
LAAKRRISRWEHEAVLEAVQARLDRNPDRMRGRTVEQPFGTTIRGWKTHFQMKTPANVATEMALHVLAYNLKRVIAGEFRHVALPHARFAADRESSGRSFRKRQP